MAIKGQVTRTLRFTREAQDGQDGQPGGSSLPPRLWKDYPAGYRFQNGRDGAKWLDVVLREDDNNAGKYYAYRCLVNHPKASQAEPVNGQSSQYWEVFGSQFKLLATEILLAQRAFVQNLIAGNIVMLDEAGNELFVADNGEVRCNTGKFRNVDVSGSLMCGDEDGKHILLDPEAEAVRIFNEDGDECAALDGSSYTSDGLMPAGKLTLKITPTDAQGKPTQQRLTLDAQNETKDPVSAAATETTAVIAQPGKIALTLSGAVNVSVAAPAASGIEVDTSADFAMPPSADLYAVIVTSDKSGNVVKTTRVRVTGLMPVWNTNGTLDQTSVSVERKMTIPVPAGKHQVRLELRAQGCSAVATYTLSLAEMVAESFMSRYFSNGFALTHDTANYLMALYEGNVMKLLLGGDLYVDKVKQPRVVYAARVTDTSTSASTACTTKQYAYLTSVSAVKQSTAGVYRFTFPAAYGLTADNCLVQLTGYGLSAGTASTELNAPVKATVKSMTVSAGVMTLDIWVSDDATANYGGFFIEVKKY